MAKICPETGDVVLYLTCLECEDKICEKVRATSDDEGEEKMTREH